MDINDVHPAVADELNLLKERFQGKGELTLDDYADYFGISRHYASQHFMRANRGNIKIAHKRIGKNDFRIALIDFAYWLASKKIDANGVPIILPYRKVSQ